MTTEAAALYTHVMNCLLEHSGGHKDGGMSSPSSAGGPVTKIDDEEETDGDDDLTEADLKEIHSDLR